MTKTQQPTRIERDCLGDMEIPDHLLYGIQTVRMMKVSGAAGYPIIAYPDLHRALFKIKKACAKANVKIGALAPEIGDAIVKTCDEALTGRYDDQFPLDMWQGGGFTCLNMNVNEVLGNAANEILTGRRGQDKVHPNTHVNKAQSTNDTIPSATHLAIAPRLDRITAELDRLAESFEKKAAAFADVVKVGRTCWQDALPLTLGQEFSGFAAVTRRMAAKLRAARPGCFELVMGGSAVGTGLGADPGYMDAFYEALSDDLGEPVRPMANLFDGFQNMDFCVTVSGLVKEVATTLSKISKDLRLMSSGPRSGFCELDLPALSPGSSIMPGKINPTVPEMVIQIAHQVVGNDVAVTMAYDEGELDLNVWDATFYKCLFESMQLVEREIPILREHCVDGITARREDCRREAERSIALSTVIAATMGYPEGVRIAHKAAAEGKTVKEVVLEEGLMSAEDAELMLDPRVMTEPERMERAIADFRKKHA